MPNKSAYHWYLRNSAFWREQRVTIFRRAKGRCEWCGRPATQVHHLNYRRVFNELPSDLVALCAECHADVHHKTPANDNQLKINFDNDNDDDD